MSRIAMPVLAKSIQLIRGMTLEQKESLFDDMFQTQPTLLTACLMQHRLGIPYEKMEFLIELILICFQSMKGSGLKWPMISEDDWERELARLTGSINFTGGLDVALHRQSIQQYIDQHPEKMLFAFVMGELTPWLPQCGLGENNEKYVLLAALTAVNCIAHVSMPHPKKKTK